MKKIALFSIAFILVLGLITPAIAINSLEDSIKDQLDPVERIYDPSDDISQESLSLTIARVIRVAIGFIGIIMIVLMVYAGFMWMTAAGNEDRITTAKKIMSAAIIGAAIVLTAYIISYFVIDQLLTATTGYGADQQEAHF